MNRKSNEVQTYGNDSERKSVTEFDPPPSLVSTATCLGGGFNSHI